MKNNFNNILMVVRDLSVGGAEKMVTQLVVGIDKNKFNVSLISLLPKVDTHLKTIIEKSNIHITYLDKPDGLRISYFVKMWKVLDSLKPDIVHTHLNSVLYVIPYILFHKVKLIHTIHSLPHKDIPLLSQLLLKILVKSGKAKLVGISKEIGKQAAILYKTPQSSLPIIYNAVDNNLFQKTFGKHISEEIVFCIVGSLREVKNHKFLIEAFCKASKINECIILNIVGDGPLRSAIEKQICDLNMKRKIKLLGIRSDIPEILSNSDVFVLASLYEGLPLCILEAMASGLPIIATRVGGIPDVMTEGRNGFLVESGDVGAYCEAILKLADNPELREIMSRNNLKDAWKYDVKVMTKKYLNLYGLTW